MPRKLGVEEELLLCDPETGRQRSLSHRALAAHAARAPQVDAELEQELFLAQLETGTPATTSVDELVRELVVCRSAAARAAEEAGAVLVAVGAHPLEDDRPVRVTPKPRYERIVEEFGIVGREASVCGMHVHVDVADDDEGVAVLDGLRPWLPVLRALSVNSPFWRGQDTGFASWRTQVWGRWPTTGPAEPFGSGKRYHEAAEALIASGAALDRGMLYLDARLAASYPTVEVRVFDVMTELDDVALVAALTRALVETVVRRPSPETWRTDLLRAAHWRASRYGLSSQLLHPQTGDPAPAREVVEATIAFCGEALQEAGDLERVSDGFEQLTARGTGASRQRAAAEAGGGVEAVVADLRARFAASYAG